MMKKLLLGALLVLLCLVPTHAAYVTATIVANEPQADGRVRLLVRFTGNAGEPSVDRSVVVDGGWSALQLRSWAISQVNDIAAARALAVNASLQPGQSFNLTPIVVTPPTPSAFDVWADKAHRLQRLKDLGLTNATAVADIQALEADVNSSYQTSFSSQY